MSLPQVEIDVTGLDPTQIDAEVAKIKAEVGDGFEVVTKTAAAVVAATEATVSKAETVVADAKAEAASVIATATTDTATLAAVLTQVKSKVAPELNKVESAVATGIATVEKDAAWIVTAWPEIGTAISAGSTEVSGFVKTVEADAVAVKAKVVADISEVETKVEAEVASVEAKAKALNQAAWLQHAESLAEADMKALEHGLGVALTGLETRLKAITPSIFSTIGKGALSGVSHVVSFAGSLISGVTLKIAAPALGSLLIAPLKLTGLIPSLEIKTGLWALLALGVGGSVFAGYLHMEHNTERLIAEAREAATQQIVAQYRAISEELVRQQAVVRTGALLDLQAADKVSAAEIDAAERALSDEPAPLPPVKSKVKHAKARSNFTRLNAGDATADRLLERYSRH